MNLPINVDAEDCLLGSWMCAFRDVGCMLVERGITPEHFHHPNNRVLATEMLEAWKDGVNLDPMVLTAILHKKGLYEDAGGVESFFKLTKMPTAANVQTYLDIVVEVTQLRQVALLCAEKGRAAVLDGAEAQSIVSGLAEGVAAIGCVKKGPSVKTMKDLAFEKLRRIEGDEDEKDVILTGITKLDMYSPLRLGDMPLISGERKAGKSILSINIALNVAQKGGSVLYLSLEDTVTKVFDRMFANVSRIELGRHKAKGLLEREMVSIAHATPKLAGLPIELRDDLHDLHSIVAVIRQKATKDPNFKLAVVDYAQLVRTGSQKEDNKEQEVAKVSRDLRLLAMELKIAIILLCQLNKQGQARWSMGLEQDCTAMWKVIVPEEDENTTRSIEVPFQRNGDSGIIFKVAFLGSTSRIESLAE